MGSLLFSGKILTNTESVSLFLQVNLENSLKKEYADMIPRRIMTGTGVGLLLIFIFNVFQNLLAEISYGATLSAFIYNCFLEVPEEKSKNNRYHVHIEFRKRQFSDLS